MRQTIYNPSHDPNVEMYIALTFTHFHKNSNVHVSNLFVVYIQMQTRPFIQSADMTVFWLSGHFEPVNYLGDGKIQPHVW